MFVLKALNFLISLLFICTLCVAGSYSTYALWDNHQVYAAAENVQDDMLRLKPQEDDGASFQELLAVNPDVAAWITLDNTNIDYPVLQGSSNLSYINTDVYGNFALAGSIFLDSRCDKTFQDVYSLLYGHHMANGSMFGDLDLYKEKAFFDENKTGKLRLPDRSYDLEIIACLTAASSDDRIFEIGQIQADLESFIGYAEQNALYMRRGVWEDIYSQEDKKYQILALSTCSSEYTDARTVVVTIMKPSKMEN